MDWIERHAVLMSVVVWPVVTALATALFKPRTPEEYSKLPPRLAAFLKLVGAIGFDVPNMIEAVKQGVANKSKSPGVYRATRSSPLPAPGPPDVATKPTLHFRADAVTTWKDSSGNGNDAVTVPEFPPLEDTPVPSTRPEKP